ncbi:MAG: DUF1217 domain-containing protein [Pseudomonadota bacterium]
MTYQPVIGVGGYGGWRILETTRVRQQETFDSSATIARDIEYFRANIESATSAEALVGDRQLLTVALGAFGLGDEINKPAFIRRVLEDGTESSTAFANRLGDQRYREFSEAFGYGNITNGTSIFLESFQEDVIARYKTLEFERAVGNIDDDMRLALNFKRAIEDISTGENVDNVGWLSIMGQAPLREVVATALGLPDATSQLDIDRQVEIFEDKALTVLGSSSASVFTDPAKVEDTIRRFFLFRQIESGPSATTAGLGALTLLQSSALGGGATVNLFQSQF